MQILSVQTLADRPLLETVADNDFLLIGDASEGGIVKKVLLSTLATYFGATEEPIVEQTLLGDTLPTLDNQSDNASYELGQTLQFTRSGSIKAIRYYKPSSETGTHIGRIWSNSGSLLASVTFTNETASGWQEQLLASPFSVEANTQYIVSVNANSHYVVNSSFADPIVLGDIVGNRQGRFGNIGQFPSGTFSTNNYLRDVVFA